MDDRTRSEQLCIETHHAPRQNRTVYTCQNKTNDRTRAYLDKFPRLVRPRKIPWFPEWLLRYHIVEHQYQRPGDMDFDRKTKYPKITETDRKV